MALRKLSNGGGSPIDWGVDYQNLSAANQLIASLSEYFGVPVTLKEYQGRKYVDTNTIEAVHKAASTKLK